MTIRSNPLRSPSTATVPAGVETVRSNDAHGQAGLRDGSPATPRLLLQDLGDELLNEVALVRAGNPGAAVLLALLLRDQCVLAGDIGAGKIAADGGVHLLLHVGLH